MTEALASEVVLRIPTWIDDVVATATPTDLGDHDGQMALVLDLARRNISQGGGPFAAAIFRPSGALLAVGVNRVVPDSAPIAHAEIMAIAAAGQSLGTWNLASVGALSLVSSTEPCAMCLGAVPWAGVSSLVVGARDADARAAGFDEGEKPSDWIAHLSSIGIDVVRDVRRDEAADVLADYVRHGGAIYNGATAGPSSDND